MSDLGIVRSYDDLHAIMRKRVADLGITRIALDDVTGLPNGYAGKIFGKSQVKKIGAKSLGEYLTALGLMLVVVEDPQHEAVVRRCVEGSQSFGRHHVGHAKISSSTRPRLRKRAVPSMPVL